MTGKPFAQFRVYPDKKRYYYFTVLVFAAKSDMVEAVNASGHPVRRPRTIKSGGYDAITLPWIQTTARGKRVLRDLGNIVFYRQRTGTGCVSHEMTHAAAHYLRIKGHKAVKEGDTEEALALAVGNLTKQFFMRY